MLSDYTVDDLYPSKELLKAIKEWPHNNNYHDLFEYIRPLFYIYGRITKKGDDNNIYDVATGGWSGNEDMIGAMQDNFVFWSLCWQLTERGGHYIFKVPKEKK